ncbi:MAG: hypothetical protein M1820_002904 [Bogoriella megaspora]|nr:MAG: hypothetical protein M1820_002904 [Bogoriella megaspora]
MVSRPNSPTSLLWAHELKRQHEFLLKRQKDLEIQNESLASAVADARTDVKALKNQAPATEQLAKAHETVQNQSSKIEALTKRMIALESKETKLNNDMDKVFKHEKTVLKQMSDLEASLQQMKSVLSNVVSNVEEIDSASLKLRLAEVETATDRQGNQMRNLAKVVNEGHLAHQTLATHIQDFKIELNSFKSRGSYKTPVDHRTVTLWRELPVVDDNGEPSSSWGHDREQASRQTALDALELLAKPTGGRKHHGQEAQIQNARAISSQISHDQIAALRQQTAPAMDCPRAPRQLGLVQNTAHDQISEESETRQLQHTGLRKRPAPVSSLEPPQPRRSERLAHRKLVDREVQMPHKISAPNPRMSSPESPCPANPPRKRNIAPRLLDRINHRKQILKPGLGVMRTDATAIRERSSSSTLSEFSSPPKTPTHQEIISAMTQRPLPSQRQAPVLKGAMQQLPRTPRRDPINVQHQRTEIRTPKNQCIEQHQSGNSGNEETASWKVPTFMLPDFSVPPTWFQPNEM